MASAIWFYMAPQPPKPSMHDIVTTRWKPSQGDIAGERVPGYGVTVMVINGGVECGGDAEMAQTVNRIQYFRAFVDHFKLEGLLGELGWPTDVDKQGCIGMKAFGEESSGAMKVNWAGHWGSDGGCYLVNYVTGCSLLDTPQNAALSYCECFVEDCTYKGGSDDGDGSGGGGFWAKDYSGSSECGCVKVDWESSYDSENACMKVECATYYAQDYSGDTCSCAPATWNTGYLSAADCEAAVCTD